MNILVPGAEFGAEIGEVAEFWDCLISRQHYVRRCFFLSRLCVNAFLYFTHHFFSRNPRNCPPSDPSEMTKSTLDCSTDSLCPSCTPMPVFFRVAYCTPLSLSNHNQFSQDPQTVLRKMPLFGPTFFLQSLLRSVTSQFCMIRHFFSAALISYPIN